MGLNKPYRVAKGAPSLELFEREKHYIDVLKTYVDPTKFRQIYIASIRQENPVPLKDNYDLLNQWLGDPDFDSKAVYPLIYYRSKSYINNIDLLDPIIVSDELQKLDESLIENKRTDGNYESMLRDVMFYSSDKQIMGTPHGHGNGIDLLDIKQVEKESSTIRNIINTDNHTEKFTNNILDLIDFKINKSYFIFHGKKLNFDIRSDTNISTKYLAMCKYISLDLTVPKFVKEVKESIIIGDDNT